MTAGDDLDAAGLARWVVPALHRPGRTAAPGPPVVAVDGRSGAGKSALAAALAGHLAALLGGPVPVAALDDTYPGWDGLEHGVERLVAGVLVPLAAGPGAGLAAVLPGWDWERGVEGPGRVVVAAGSRPAALVVEGVGAGARACAPLLSLLVWVEAPDEVRYARAMARDGDLYAPHWQRWAAQEERHLAREATRDRADLVLDASRDGGRYTVLTDRTLPGGIGSSRPEGPR